MLNLSNLPSGSLVVCEIFQLFEHTGIYIGDGHIVELQGNGLVRAISVQRFLQGRSGHHLLVATTAAQQVMASPICAERAISQIYTYQEYDLFRNNCHRFSFACISGRSEPVTSFFDLKTEIQHFWRQEVSWTFVDVDA